LGLVFLPLTTVIYVLVSPGGLSGFDWLLLIFGVIGQDQRDRDGDFARDVGQQVASGGHHCLDRDQQKKGWQSQHKVRHAHQQIVEPVSCVAGHLAEITCR
jgi:hypothetical protein